MLVCLQRFKARLSPRIDLYISILLALVPFVIYLRTLAPGVLDGDSGEWQYMANILGVPHSTGYPLYVLLAKLFTLVPFGNAAWRVNLFSAFCAALVVPLVYLLAQRVSHSRAAAVLTAAFFAFAPTLWASATIAEVYALNTLLSALTLCFAVRYYDHAKPRDLYLTAWFYGLALTNHRIALFFAPAFLWLILIRKSSLSTKSLVSSLALVLVPLLLYLYIPLRASQLLAEQSPENWALYPRAEAILNGKVTAYYNPTPYGVFNLITAFDNRNKLGFEGASGSNTLATRLTNALELLREQLDPFGIALALVGIVILIRRERGLALLFLVAALAISTIAIFLRAESTRFYFSASYLVIFLFLAVALGTILEQLIRAPILYAAAVVFFAFFPASAFVFNYPRVDSSQNTKYELYARAVLGDNLASDAVVLAPWEVATPIRYLQFVENVRQDVLVIHESPVRPQYQKLLDAAHRLGRPFYYVQFTPEDKNTDAPRSVQAIPFPIPENPVPQEPLNAKLTDGIRLIGFDWTPMLAQPQPFARLTFYYQVTAPTRTEYAAELTFADIRGETHGDWTRRPVSEYYPTYLWQPREYYREVWDIPLTDSMAKGLYTGELTWYELDSNAGALKEETARTVEVGPLRLGDFDAEPSARPQPAAFENGMRLLGYTVDVGKDGSNGGDGRVAPNAARPGETLTVSLSWATTRALSTSLTMFVHLVDSSGVVRAQSDHAGWDGMYPTDRWSVGETVQDKFRLTLPSDLQAGEYRLRVGLYANPEHPKAILLADTTDDQVTLDQVIEVLAK